MGFERIERAAVEAEAERVASVLKGMMGWRPWTAVPVLNGGLVWFTVVAQAMERIGWERNGMIVAPTKAELYKGNVRQEEITVSVTGSRHLFEKRKVVCFDDIVDGGTTRQHVAAVMVRNMGVRAKDIFWCPMLSKERWRVGRNADLVGLWIADDAPWLAGMGMDYNGRHRGVEFIDEAEVVDREVKAKAKERKDEQVDLRDMPGQAGEPRDEAEAGGVCGDAGGEGPPGVPSAP